MVDFLNALIPEQREGLTGALRDPLTTLDWVNKATLFMDGDNATDLVFKKSFADVATEEEFWQWVYGPVVGAIWVPI